MRVSEGLIEILESERRRRERFNDTMLRIIMERGLQAKEISDLKENNDYLIRVIEELKLKVKVKVKEPKIIQN